MIYVFEKASGRVIQVVIGSDESSSNYADDSVGVLISSEYHDPDSVYVDDEMFVEIPQSPPHHTWDWPTKSWLPDLPAAIAARKNEIDRERDRRINLPLAYDGKVLDADMTARDNLKAKLEEVRERIRLNMPMAPELLVWRDNSNQTHSWQTIEAYHDWLAGYAVAMSDRGTRCYACAWHHKDVLKAANDPNGQPWTVETVQGYSLTQGWPA
jgi:hypothetical protein